jgi:hypothetical protein
MTRGLLVLNVFLVGASLASIVYTARQVTAPPPVSPARAPARGAPPGPAASAATASAEARPAPGSYNVVASRNLFSPGRSEAPTGPAAAAPPAPRPNLYGVVLREGAPIAYLEDPATKRVAGYRPGDTVAGGTVQLIAADHVVLVRPEGRVEVRLTDPAKPRAPAPVAPGQAVPPPGGPPPVGSPRIPPVWTPPSGQVTPAPPPTVTQGPTLPGRRPLPPGLRRLLPGTIPDVAPQ